MSSTNERMFTRRDFFKFSGAFGAAAGLAVAVSACAPADTNSSAGQASTGADASALNEDGTITAAISYELGTNGYDPMVTSAALTVAANWHTLEGLTEIDAATGETYAALASSMPTANGTTAEVQLREGAKFHDGTDVTAEDVVFSFQRVLDPANNSLYASFIPFITDVTAKDDRTVEFTLAHEVGVFADRLAVVKIVPKAAVEADPDAFSANPVGTGPYRMTENGANKTIRFERFDDYTGPRPARAAKMEWQIIPDPSTRTNALQSKTVQAIDSVPYLSIDQLKATDTVESVQGFGLLFAMFNNEAGNPFADVRNRQAFLYAIDMGKVIQTGLSDQATPATSFLHEEHPNYKRAANVYSFDQARARELFAETGLTKMRLLCTDHDWVRKCTPLIQESLVAAGIEVEFTEKKSADVYNTIDGVPGAYDVVIAPGDPSVFGTDPDLLMRWWYAADTWTDTRMHWKGTAEYEQLQTILAEGLEATDSATQEQKWGEAFDLISEAVPLYPLFHRKTPTAWDGTTLVDFKPISVTGLTFVGVGSTK
ncbi:ABC transporter substrate-binding protein [Corynebacterium kozikiae]|uniref:ABC transporter substrate-binding protein n=1 Tax=Corynebacterium kozikiae TaxID=2968469 RepID=UPI00211C9AB1|nr:ABC transporter substrate-binding protein [Corynebacterium sp. 76QC2CO]MCQ9342647.1 ABC transporter substrate-binding protein [Corynebacterium sp. 76QC2CO]